MPRALNPGVVVFTGNRSSLARFYQAVAGLSVRVEDDRVTVLATETFDLVLHDLPGEPRVENPPRVREDTWIKPFFPVPSLAEARAKAEALGGKLQPVEKEWSWRGFRASEAHDPDGNVIQFRELI